MLRTKRHYFNKSQNDNWLGKTTQLKELMWNQVGIVRTTAELEDALARVKKFHLKLKSSKSFPKETLEDFQTYKNLVDCALVMIKSALNRKESRGLHFVKDYPFSRDTEKRHYSWTKDKI